MGLTGTRKKDGTIIQALPHCSWCKDDARYTVTTKVGIVLYACEEHAQVLWDEDEQYAEAGSERK
jgi:hypothetical protein